MNFSNIKLSFNVDQESFLKLNYRPFIFGMIAVVVMKLISLAGFQPTVFQNETHETVSVFDTLRPKLEQKVNSFKLKKNTSLIPQAVAAADYDNANAYAVVDLDTGEIITEKDGDIPHSIASITKVMTAVVALDLASPDESFVVSQKAADIEPTKIGVVAGQTMTVNELLHASLLTSANDATEVIKEGIDAKYGEDVFIDAMNSKAAFIGMENTRFANTQGFDDPNHYSTAHDLALLAHYAMNNYPLIREIVAKDYEFLAENEQHKQFDLYNWNGLLDVYPKTYGIKIGNTGDAGVTTMVASERGGKNIAVILLGASDVLERDLWAAQLLDVGYEQTIGLDPIVVTEEELRAKYATWKYFN